MNVALWVVQILLSLLFLMGGGMKVFQYDKTYRMWPWVRDYSKAFVTFVGCMDLLAGLGLILPQLTGIFPWLTPLTALGASVILTLAIVLHIKRNEIKNAIPNIAFLALAIFVIIGRFH
ncbi:DoxX family protein [Paenibacillus agricola]|uniref:DoxX family protein n=1 Tax=Paenibacillus agricola TaxID=2716264 RepID=A0ABX0J8Y4_9BACL|nr:DoxX family protein [Paenibacillus agricola]NHN31855.1 DoxX family protein [Paenibacillus agricola]